MSREKHHLHSREREEIRGLKRKFSGSNILGVKEFFRMFLLAVFALLASSAMPAATAMAAVLVEDGAYVSFGSWQHATDEANNKEPGKTPVVWQKKADDTYLSRYLIDSQKWHSTNAMPDGNWKGSDLRAWLNGTFRLGAFDAWERGLLRPDAGGDAGALVTIPDTTNPPAWAGESRFGKIRYRKNAALADGSKYWLRQRYEQRTNQAWGVGIYGLQGEEYLNVPHGIAPIVSLNLSPLALKAGSGTAGDPYVLYGTSEAMKPAGIAVSGDQLTLKFGTGIAALGSLPAPAAFAVTKNETPVTVAEVSVSAADSTELVLKLSEGAVYGDLLKVSYTLSLNEEGTLIGGGIRSISGNNAALSFAAMSTTNETLPTEADVTVTPSSLQTLEHRPFSAQVAVANAKSGGALTLTSVTKGGGWDLSGLSYGFDPAGTIDIGGTPTSTGRYALGITVTVDGTSIEIAEAVVVTVDSTGTNPSESTLLVKPDKSGPVVLRERAEVNYTVSSSISDASLSFTNVSGAAGWQESGLTVTPNYSGNTFRVEGVAAKVGTYKLLVDAVIDGVTIEDKEVAVQVVPPKTDPTPADVRITSDLKGEIVKNRPTEFTYTVGSSIAGAEVELESVTGGADWLASALGFTPDQAAKTVRVWGTPVAAGEYSLLFDVRIDTVLVKDVEVRFQIQEEPENPGGENPGGENPGGENPGGENPDGENPGGENPGGENPGGENPGGENPGGENPGGVLPTAIYFDKSGLNLMVGETQRLAWTVEPAGAGDKRVTFASSNPYAIEVDEAGTVTAKASGTAMITVQAVANGLKDTMVVSATNPAVVPDIVRYWEIEPKSPPYFTGEEVAVHVNLLRGAERIEVVMTNPDGSTQVIETRTGEKGLDNYSSFVPEAAGEYTSVMTLRDAETGATYVKTVKLTVLPGGETAIGGGGSGCDAGSGYALLPLGILLGLLAVSRRRSSK